MSETLDLSEFDRLMGKLERLPADLAGALRPGMEEAVQLVEQAVIERMPVAGGNLRGSVNTAVTVDETGITGIVGTATPYAIYVEEGTRPHWPPLEPLVEWVKKKHLTGVYSIKTRRRLGNPATNAAEDLRVARAIQVKIARRGTPGQHVFRDGWAAAKEQAAAALERSIDAALKELI